MALVAITSILAGFILKPQPASADPGLQRMVYEVYAGGIHAVQAELTIDTRKPDRYDLNLFAKTRGLLGSLAPWHGTFESHGWVMSDGAFRPEQHKSTANWREEVEIKDYLYNKDGTFKQLLITDEHSDAEPRDVDQALTDGTVDALTAALQVFEAYNKTGQCTGESEVFDGKRRFKQVFNHQGQEDLTASKYNIYEGPSALCAVEVVPIAGEWHKKPRGWMSIQEQGRDRGLLPTVWVAQMTENAPAIPVKIKVKTAYGTLFMHLAEYQSAETLLVAEKRITEDE